MAELHVQPKKRNYWWIWVIILLIIIAAAVYYYENYYVKNNNNTSTNNSFNIKRHNIPDVLQQQASLTVPFNKVPANLQ